jgi:hypothetical protein
MSSGLQNYCDICYTPIRTGPSVCDRCAPLTAPFKRVEAPGKARECWLEVFSFENGEEGYGMGYTQPGRDRKLFREVVGNPTEGVHPDSDRVVALRLENQALADSVLGCAKRVAELRGEVSRLREGLRPCARFGKVLLALGGHTPKTGAWYGLHVGSESEALITIEDFKAALEIVGAGDDPEKVEG